MYETTYGLTERPFQPIPQSRYYFPSRVAEQCRTTLERVIDRGEGPALLIGPAGTGKTMLCRVLADNFSRRFTVVSIGSMALGRRRDLYQAMLHDMKMPCRGMDEGEMRLAVLDALNHPEIPTDGILLIIDEAHLMAARLIEELRLLTNIDYMGHPRVRLVLAADGYLEERLASPRLESLNQRLAARCYLQSIDRSEVGPYLAHQILRAGSSLEQLFLPDAVQAIAVATDGNPRLINQLADHALLQAASTCQAAEPLTAADIQQAWSDLQQLPAPWNTESPAENTDTSVIEFGPLPTEQSDSEVSDIAEWKSLDKSTHGEAMEIHDDDTPVIVELPRREEDSHHEKATPLSVDKPVWDATTVIDKLTEEDDNQDSTPERNPTSPPVIEPAPPAEDPFAVPFAEEVAIDLAVGVSPTRREGKEKELVTPSAATNPSESVEVAESSVNWLPMETLWVTPGTIPELPRDDRDMIEVADVHHDSSARDIDVSNRTYVIQNPSDLASIR